MPYNPTKHHRRSIRLKGYDYSQAGYYFVTICCHARTGRFGRITNGQMVLNENGRIAYNEWIKLPERYPFMVLGVFQIMPNHIHGIIALTSVEAPAAHGGPATHGAPARGAPTGDTEIIGNIVGAYKSLVMTKCLKLYESRNEFMGKWWQRNYYEQIIRNGTSYRDISEYITNNPAKWSDDIFYMEE